MLIMAIGPLPDALKPAIHGVRAHWIRGFTASERTGSGVSWRSTIEAADGHPSRGPHRNVTLG